MQNGTEVIEEIVNATDNDIYRYCEYFLENYLGFSSEVPQEVQ